MRQRLPRRGWYHNDVHSGAVFGVHGTLYAVLVAFVIFLSFQSFASARQYAAEEAIAVTAMHREAGLFEPADWNAVRGQLRCYATAVVNDDWPAMAEGETSDTVEDWLVALDQTVGTTTINGAKQATLFGNWLDQSSERREGRRGRLTEAAPFVPGPLWVVLLFGGALVVGNVVVFSTRRERAVGQVVTITTLTAMVVACLLVIQFLDRPFADRVGSIRPTEMLRTLELMDRVEPEEAQPPCDSDGMPRSG